MNSLSNIQNTKFHDILKVKIHKFVTYSYKITEKFPKSELCCSRLLIY